VHEVLAEVSLKQLVTVDVAQAVAVVVVTPAVDAHEAQTVVEPLTTLHAAQPVTALPPTDVRHKAQVEDEAAA